MSHAEQLAFLRAVVGANQDVVRGADVLEIGSYDVNGSVRSLFSSSQRYVGVDLCAGPGVDVVSYGHEVAMPDASFDVVISAECFEHDPHWSETFTNMVRLTRPGGLVAFTCASHGRPEHGTRRTRLDESPGTQAAGLDYYRNLGEGDFVDRFHLPESFAEWRFWSTRRSFDLYFAGVRTGGVAGGRHGRLPLDGEVAAIDGIMPLAERLVRAPLHVARATTQSEERYQDVILRYWRAVQAVRQVGFRSRLKRRVR